MCRSWLTYRAELELGVGGKRGFVDEEHLPAFQKVWNYPSCSWRALTETELGGVSCLVWDAGLDEREAAQLL